MPTHRKHPGKSLEILIASIERVLGHNQNVTVQSPAYVPDRITGEPREHDVLITITGSHHKSNIAIECRDRSRKITVNDVEGFWSKCQDTGVDQGIVVSSKGFSKTALSKAAHRSIRCLQLAEVESFNWLLASGIRSITRKVQHTNWTFFPEVGINPPPVAFTILTDSGDPIDSSVLVAAAFEEFQKLPRDEESVHSGEKRIVFNDPGLFMRNDTNGNISKIVKALAIVRYSVVESFIPFQLVSYSNSSSGELITDAAIAECDLGDSKGKIMFVYNEKEGGQVVFVPDKRDAR